MTATADEAPIVVREVFPARVIAGDHAWSTCRVIITRDRVLAYLDRSGPVLDAEYVPEVSTVPRYNEPRSQPAHLVLLDGTAVTVTRQRGCGCSSSVRSWRPWQPFRGISA